MPKHLLGVIHLGPCPSASGAGSFDKLLAAARRDAEAWAKGGATGLVVENYGDVPFHKGTRDDPVPPDVVATLAVVARDLRERTRLPIAVNCLRNDGVAALGAAAAAGAPWIRVNVLTSACVTDQGIIEGEAGRLFAYHKRLGSRVQVLADYLVKHSIPLGEVDVAQGAKDLARRSGAAGIVLSGSGTGAAVDVGFVDTVRAAVGRFPIWLGSGLDKDNAAELWPRCDGAIVGTSCKRGGRTEAAVDVARVRALVKALRAAERSAAGPRRRQR